MNFQSITSEYIEGAISLQHNNLGIQPWRLPHDRLPLFPSPYMTNDESGNKMVDKEKKVDALETSSRLPIGIRVRFQTESSCAGLRIEATNADRRFDLVIDNELKESQILPAGQSDLIFNGLPGDHQPVEIWLSHQSEVNLQGILTQGGVANPCPDRRKRWVTYGSSITGCGAAHSPARTWPATASRLHNLHLTCFGFGGNCHLEPMMAMTLREVPADLITLKVGINIQGGASLSARTFMSSVIGFVRIIREKQIHTPIVLISPVLSPPRETQRNVVGLNLVDMRELIHEAVDRMQTLCSDHHLYYRDGSQLFDLSWIPEFMPDQLHPNGDGYEMLGVRFADQVISTLEY